MDKSNPRFIWKVHHLVDGGIRSWLLGVLIFCLCLAAARFIGEGYLALLVTVVFLYSLKEFLLPHTYEIYSDAVVITTSLGSRREPWNRFHGYAPTRAGILLTRFPGSPILTSLRGLHLTILNEKKEAVLKFIDRRLKAAVNE